MNSDCQIDESISRLSDIILKAHDIAIPTSMYRNRHSRIAPDTLKAIKYKNYLNRKWQRCHDADAKNRLKSSVNIVGKLIEDLVTRDRTAKWSEFMNQIEDDSKKLWRVSRSIRGKRTAIPIPNIIWHEGRKITTNDEKAESIASIFERAHIVTINATHPHDATVARFTNSFGDRAHTLSSHPLISAK